MEQAATAGEETAGLSTANMVYLVPTGETGGQPRSISAWQGRFTMQQVPPGNYLAVAFAEQPEDLAYGNDEATRLLLSKGGQGIHLEAGQKAKVKVRVIDSEGK